MTRNTHNDLLDHEELRVAADVPYDNSGSGLSATDLQGAVDELSTGGTTPGLVSISAGDSSRAYLNDKLVAGSGITTTILNPGGDEQLQVRLSGGGGTIFLGGQVGSPHTGTGGAVGTDPTAAESDHQHPAQVLLTGGSQGDMVATARHSSISTYNQLELGLEPGTGFGVLRFKGSSGTGVQLRQPLASATGDDRGILSIDGIGGVRPSINLGDADSLITRGGTEGTLWDGDVGLTVAAYSHTHETTLVAGTTFNSTSTVAANIGDLTSTSFAAGTFHIQANLRINTAASTTGIGLGFAFGGTISVAAITARIPISATAEEVFFQTTNAMSTSSGYTSGSGRMAMLEAIVTTTSSGTIATRFATEVNTSQVSVLAGSFMTIRVIA